jgi:hypothetical protein
MGIRIISNKWISNQLTANSIKVVAPISYPDLRLEESKAQGTRLGCPVKVKSQNHKTSNFKLKYNSLLGISESIIPGSHTSPLKIFIMLLLI